MEDLFRMGALLRRDVRFRYLKTVAVLMFVYPCLADSLSIGEAVKANDMNAARTLITDNADVNAPLADGSTPLHWAAYQDSPEIVNLLLKAGARANVADEYGETPLTLACVNGDAKIVKDLLGAGADPNAARWNGETPLMVAARTGNPEVVELLIGDGAKVEAVESIKGQNGLMWAAAEGQAGAVEALLKAGARPDAASKAGGTPLIFASARGSLESVALLLAAGADINRANPAGMNPLLTAVTSARRDVVELLLERGATIEFRDPGGNTALHLASQAGNPDLVKLLIAKGANVNARTGRSAESLPIEGAPAGRRAPGSGQTPLLLAARGGYPEVMRLLVEAGADTKVKASDGTTLLLAAAASARIKTVKYAYTMDQDVKAVTNRNQTVLHLAAAGFSAGSAEVVQFFADKGAPLDTPDAAGDTPLDITIADGQRSDSQMLLTRLIRATGAEPRKRAE